MTLRHTLILLLRNVRELSHYNLLLRRNVYRIFPNVRHYNERKLYCIFQLFGNIKIVSIPLECAQSYMFNTFIL